MERLILQSLTPAVVMSAQDAGVGRQIAPTPTCWPRSSYSNKVYKYQSDRVRIARSQPGSKTTAPAPRRALGLLPCEQRGNRKGLKTYILSNTSVPWTSGGCQGRGPTGDRAKSPLLCQASKSQAGGGQSSAHACRAPGLWFCGV